MESEDVQDDRSEHEQTEVARFRDGDEDAAEDFADFDEGHETRRADGAEEECRWRSLWWSTAHRDEVQEEIETEDDEG